MTRQWSLRLRVLPLRPLTELMFYLGRVARPKAPQPSRTIRIPRSLSRKDGEITLYIYTPLIQKEAKKEDSRRPVVVNFHGGGFILGRATDDSRWARSVNEYLDAVVVSVEYSLAPEHPFPAAVEDGVDALLWIIEHADELQIDPLRIATSGFSAGGNLSFTVPIRLAEEMKRREEAAGQTMADGKRNSDSLPLFKIVAIAAWYPSVDYSLTRAQRRKTNERPEKSIAPWFTDLVDSSFLYGVKEEDRRLPWMSPAVAPEEILQELPYNIVMYTCEWDELRDEAERLKQRLVDMGKKVVHQTVPGTTHGFDKRPSLKFKYDPKLEELYKNACLELRPVFQDSII